MGLIKSQKGSQSTRSSYTGFTGGQVGADVTSGLRMSALQSLCSLVFRRDAWLQHSTADIVPIPSPYFQRQEVKYGKTTLPRLGRL